APNTNHFLTIGLCLYSPAFTLCDAPDDDLASALPNPARPRAFPTFARKKVVNAVLDRRRGSRKHRPGWRVAHGSSVERHELDRADDQHGRIPPAGPGGLSPLRRHPHAH